MTGRWAARFCLTAVCAGLGLLLVIQLRTQSVTRRTASGEGWQVIVADLVASNARLREQIDALEPQLSGLQDTEGGGVVLQVLVDEVNHLRVANGLVAVSGEGIEVTATGQISVLDLQDLINELRNAGAEALALDGRRVVTWSAVSTDGDHVTVDGQPVQRPFRLEAIGDAATLERALVRPGGLVDLLAQAGGDTSLLVVRRERVTVPVYEQPLRFVYAVAEE